MERNFHFKAIFTKKGWKKNVSIKMDKLGNIQSIDYHSEGMKNSRKNSSSNNFKNFLIPGMINSHSHCFQYAMGGLAEGRVKSSKIDNFWTWREKMYHLANKIGPDEIEVISEVVYSEMLKFGITEVVEFHYLHHDINGRQYKNPCEMAEKILKSAKKSGIEITLVPIFYQMGGFKKKPLPRQKRFIFKGPDQYFKFLDKFEGILRGHPQSKMGIGIHSLRAAKVESIKEIINFSLTRNRINLDNKFIPFHIHLAEQVKEVEECKQILGLPPVDWILEKFPVDRTFNLVHCTQMNLRETRRLAKTGSNVVICPTTEGNLGDGFFPLMEFLKYGGTFSIGTDSNINLNPLEEFRMLDYGQRMLLKKRNVVCLKGGEWSGDVLAKGAWKGGAQAIGDLSDEYFEIGKPLTGVILDERHPAMLQRPDYARLSSFIYASDPSIIVETICRGKAMVKNGEHKNFNNYRKSFNKIMAKIYH